MGNDQLVVRLYKFFSVVVAERVFSNNGGKVSKCLNRLMDEPAIFLPTLPLPGNDISAVKGGVFCVPFPLSFLPILFYLRCEPRTPE